MKRIVFIAVALAMMFGINVGSASAANSLKSGSFGFNVGLGDSLFGDKGAITISGKYLIMNDLAVLVGVGMQGSSGDLDANYFSTSVGARKYLKIDDFAPFVGGTFSYASEKNNTAGNINRKAFDLSGNFGAEYFLHKQFSIEGSVGIGFGTVEDKTGPNLDYTYFGTRTVGVSANFYFF
jgi:hypothetical protein